jgi:MOSC domain-containing protein
MGGHQVEQLRVDGRGGHADRLSAVRDLEYDVTASARRVPKLLGCSAAYVTAPGPDAGPGNVPEVAITFPDGTVYSSSDPAVHATLSELVGREVRLTALPLRRRPQHAPALGQAVEGQLLRGRRRRHPARPAPRR